MDSDFPWVYVAMIFIAFVSWIRARLQEAAEMRRVKALKKKAAQAERRSSSLPSPVSPYLHPSPQVPHSKPVVLESTKVETPVPEVPKTFRELFEVLQGQMIGQTEPPSVTQTAPPPLPVRPAPRAEVPVAATAISLPEITPSVSTRAHQGRKVARNTSGDLSRMLKTRGTLREALIMKEILDIPVSLRD
ncbi:MAG: hypothetical protein ABL994_06235 [Verrucomicrobiales bacterium]